jgi:hypothetical protein
MEELIEELNKLSESQFSKTKQIYSLTQRISATTREDFAEKAKAKNIEKGVIKLIKAELNGKG